MVLDINMRFLWICYCTSLYKCTTCFTTSPQTSVFASRSAADGLTNHYLHALDDARNCATAMVCSFIMCRRPAGRCWLPYLRNCARAAVLHFAVTHANIIIQSKDNHKSRTRTHDEQHSVASNAALRVCVCVCVDINYSWSHDVSARAQARTMEHFRFTRSRRAIAAFKRMAVNLNLLLLSTRAYTHT